MPNLSVGRRRDEDIGALPLGGERRDGDIGALPKKGLKHFGSLVGQCLMACEWDLPRLDLIIDRERI